MIPVNEASGTETRETSWWLSVSLQFYLDPRDFIPKYWWSVSFNFRYLCLATILMENFIWLGPRGRAELGCHQHHFHYNITITLIPSLYLMEAQRWGSSWMSSPSPSPFGMSLSTDYAVLTLFKTPLTPPPPPPCFGRGTISLLVKFESSLLCTLLAYIGHLGYFIPHLMNNKADFGFKVLKKLTSKTEKMRKYPKTANFGHVLVYLSNQICFAWILP